MSVIDLDKLLAEISPDAPAGADVEFDPAYFELEKLAQGTPESVMGDEVKPAEEPEFADVKKAALELFEKTRDLRVAMILATALLKEDSLPGFLDGANLVKGFIEKLWEQFYPKLDPTDNNDPTIRINILKGFEGDGSSADLYKFKNRLREAILTNSKQKIGRFSFRDIQVAKGEIPPPPVKEGQQGPADISLINAAFEDTADEDLQATQAALAAIGDALSGIDAALAEKIGGGVGPDFTGIKDVVGQIKGAVEEHLLPHFLSHDKHDSRLIYPVVSAGGDSIGASDELPVNRSIFDIASGARSLITSTKLIVTSRLARCMKMGTGLVGSNRS